MTLKATAIAQAAVHTAASAMMSQSDDRKAVGVSVTLIITPMTRCVAICGES